MSQTLKNYLSLVKFSHTVFALPFALIGMTMGLKASQFEFKYPLILYIILCMVFARNAAMAFNRYLDRNFDIKNPRTAQREIPAGKISSKSALIFTIVNSALFIGVTYFINPLCFYLSPVALFVILFYSYTKRFTALCHLVLGIGLGLAPVGAYIAITETFSLIPVLIGCAVVMWTSGFDIIYALQDDEFDSGMKLHSIPSTLGRKNALNLSICMHIVCLILLAFVGIFGDFHMIYWIGFLFFMIMIYYQHSLVKPNDLSKVGIAFGTTNGIASVVFGIITIISILIH